MLQNLGKFITPKMGYTLLKKEIEKQANLSVKEFTINYAKMYSNLKFKVTDADDGKHTFPFVDAGDKLASVIKIMISAQVKQDLEIDAFIIDFGNGENIKAQVFFKDEKGEKCYIDIEL